MLKTDIADAMTVQLDSAVVQSDSCGTEGCVRPAYSFTHHAGRSLLAAGVRQVVRKRAPE
jgi:hypothetical protein